jgi:hypothetical protein
MRDPHTLPMQLIRSPCTSGGVEAIPWTLIAKNVTPMLNVNLTDSVCVPGVPTSCKTWELTQDL